MENWKEISQCFSSSSLSSQDYILALQDRRERHGLDAAWGLDPELSNSSEERFNEAVPWRKWILGRN
jgi:hypothetical protein